MNEIDLPFSLSSKLYKQCRHFYARPFHIFPDGRLHEPFFSLLQLSFLPETLTLGLALDPKIFFSPSSKRYDSVIELNLPLIVYGKWMMHRSENVL